MSRHNAHLLSYVKLRRERPLNGGTSARPNSKNPSKTTKKASKGRNSNTSPNFLLPDELVSKIFSFLSPSEILICARVCKQWNVASNEMLLWLNHYDLVPRSVRDSILPRERVSPTFQWKNEIINRTVIQRNKKVKVMLKRLNPYTGLSAGTEQVLKFLSIKWQLSFKDKNDQEYSFVNDDMFCFASSVTIRWYTLQLPSIRKLKSLAVSALTPVFYHRNWKAHTNSATRSSLLIEFTFNDIKLSKENCISQDEMITLHAVHPGIMLAVWKSSWKDGGEVAFFSISFHHHQLIERIILGSRERIHRPPTHRPVIDDINPCYGLHRYSATVELRNQRKAFWGYHYRELFRESFNDEYLIIRSHEEQEGIFNSKTSLPWKTPLFKNILNDMAIVDLTLLDEHAEPMWCVSSPVKVVEGTEDEVDYTYSDGTRSVVEYQENVGKLRIELIWIEQDQQNLVRVTEIHLNKHFINDWFGTKY